MFFIGARSVIFVSFASVQNIPKYYTILYLYIMVSLYTKQIKQYRQQVITQRLLYLYCYCYIVCTCFISCTCYCAICYYIIAFIIFINILLYNGCVMLLHFLLFLLRCFCTCFFLLFQIRSFL